MIAETKAVVEALWKAGRPVHFTELPEIIPENEVAWGRSVKEKFKRIFNGQAGDGIIVRCGQGMYAHRDFAHVEIPQEEVVKIEPPKPEPVQIITPKVEQETINAPFRLKVGMIFEGILTNITEYGIFVEEPTTRLSGLVYKTNIYENGTEASHSELLRLFSIGQNLKVQVLPYRNSEKLTLSARNVGNNLSREAARRVTAAPTTITAAPVNMVPPKPVEIPPAPVRPEPQEDLHLGEPVEQLVSFIKKSLGAVSTPALAELRRLVVQHGIVNSTLAIAKELQSFEVDMGLMFVRQVEKKMGDSL